jgi:hypothetical protein
MDKITTTIKREWLAQIAAKEKRIEYREIKPYWTKRFERVQAPFLLRLINGMDKFAPRLTVIVSRVRKNGRSGEYELRLGKIVDVQYWDVKRRKPSRHATAK